MSDNRPPIRLPLGFVVEDHAVIASEPLDDDQFARCQIEFAKYLFGRAEFLRKHGRATPVSDAFLSAFVNMLDLLVENTPAEGARCAAQLRQVLEVLFVDPGNDTAGAG